MQLHEDEIEDEVSAYGYDALNGDDKDLSDFLNSNPADTQAIETINEFISTFGIDEAPELELDSEEKERLFRLACAQALPDVVRYFLHHGVDVNSKDEKSGFTCLHSLAENYPHIENPKEFLETLAILLRQDALEVNATDINGCTFLYHLIKNAPPTKDDISNSMVALLQTRQVNFDCVSERTKVTALDLALDCKKLELFLPMLQGPVSRLNNAEKCFQYLHHGVSTLDSDCEDDVEITSIALGEKARGEAIQMLMQKIKGRKLLFYRSFHDSSPHQETMDRVELLDKTLSKVYLSPKEFTLSISPSSSGIILASSSLLAVMLPTFVDHQELFGSEGSEKMIDPVLVSEKMTGKDLLNVMKNADSTIESASSTVGPELSPRGSRILTGVKTLSPRGSRRLSTPTPKPDSPLIAALSLMEARTGHEALEKTDKVSWGKAVSVCLIGNINVGEFTLIENQSKGYDVVCKSPNFVSHEGINPLYCVSDMRQSIMGEVRDYIATLDPAQIIHQWIKEMSALDKKTGKIFSANALPQQKTELSPRSPRKTKGGELSPRSLRKANTADLSPRTYRKKFGTRNTIDPSVVLARNQVTIAIPENYLATLVSNIFKAIEAVRDDQTATYMDLALAIDGELEGTLEQAFNEASTPHTRLERARSISSEAKAKIKKSGTKMISLEEARDQAVTIFDQLNNLKSVQREMYQGDCSKLPQISLHYLREKALNSLDFRRLKGQQRIQLEILNFLSLDAFQYSALDLSHCEELSPEFLASILAKSENLQHLNLSHCANVGDYIFPLLEKHCVKLKSLQLSKTGITQWPSLKLGKLKQVDISGCENLKSVDFSPPRRGSVLLSLMRAPETVLTEVNFSGCINLGEAKIDSDYLRTLIANNCPVLPTIVVNHGKQIKSLATIEIDDCTELRVLDTNPEQLKVFKAFKVHKLRKLAPIMEELLWEQITSTSVDALASAERAGSAATLLNFTNAQIFIETSIISRNMQLLKDTRLTNPDLTGATLTGLELLGIHWKNACLAMVHWDGATLEGAQLPGARFDQRPAVQHSKAIAKKLTTEQQRTNKLCYMVANEKRGIFATAGDNKYVVLWKLDTLKPYKVLEQTDTINGLSIHSDRNLLAISCQDGTVQVWDLQKDRRLKTFNFPRSQVSSLAFSQSAGLIAATSTSADKTRSSLLLERMDNSEPINLIHTAPIYCSATHPAKEIIATAGDQNTVMFWDTKGTRLLHELSEGEAKNPHTSALAFTPGGNFLIAASTDKCLRIYHFDEQNQRLKTPLIKTIDQQAHPVTFMKILPDPYNSQGCLIFTAQNDPKSSDHKVIIFSLTPKPSPELISIASSEFAHFKVPVLSMSLIQSTHEVLIGLSDGRLIAIKLPNNLHEMPRHRSFQLSCRDLLMSNCDISEENRSLLDSLGALKVTQPKTLLSPRSAAKMVRLSSVFRDPANPSRHARVDGSGESPLSGEPSPRGLSPRTSPSSSPRHRPAPPPKEAPKAPPKEDPKGPQNF